MQRFLALLITTIFVTTLLLTSEAQARYQGRILKSYYSPAARQLLQPTAKKVPWTGYFSAKRFSESQTDRQKLNNVRQNLRQAMTNLFPEQLDMLHSLEVNNLSHHSRGLAGSHRMILNLGTIDTDDELTAVFTHEMGHIVDLGMLKGTSQLRSGFIDRGTPVPADDPSTDFYRISWINSDAQKPRSIRSDFVSGYAMENPFEDFAESFLFYRYHGDKFRALSRTSSALQKKYNFMKETVFYGKEFQNGKDFTHQNTIWDTTLLPLSS